MSQLQLPVRNRQELKTWHDGCSMMKTMILQVRYSIMAMPYCWQLQDSCEPDDRMPAATASKTPNGAFLVRCASTETTHWLAVADNCADLLLPIRLEITTAIVAQGDNKI